MANNKIEINIPDNKMAEIIADLSYEFPKPEGMPDAVYVKQVIKSLIKDARLRAKRTVAKNAISIQDDMS